MIFQFNGVIPTATIFSQCFQLKRIEPGIFHFALKRGVSILPAPSPPKWWKRSFILSFPPRLWTVPNHWIDGALPALPFFLDDRSPNLRRLLERLNESPYDCKLMTEDRLLSHFGLRPRVEPLGNRWVSLSCFLNIIFSKLLREEHRAATTPPNTRSSGGFPPLEIRVGNALLQPNLGHSQKDRGQVLLRLLLLALLAISLCLRLLLPLLRIMEEDFPLSFISSRGGGYDHLMLDSEKEVTFS
ncbi:UNVERIFIED_CONTAM: hypothetical protein Sangu_0796400 [Sesamum angustifolium]|uniref:Uncharacterized protein n=1 Tax=Sesamum angustifolium TaxID=2727405 RepID=A0AAW2PVG6_9LAMI